MAKDGVNGQKWENLSGQRWENVSGQRWECGQRWLIYPSSYFLAYWFFCWLSIIEATKFHLPDLLHFLFSTPVQRKNLSYLRLVSRIVPSNLRTFQIIACRNGLLTQLNFLLVGNGLITCTSSLLLVYT